MTPEDDKQPGLHRDPIYLAMREFRREAQRRIDVDFSECQLAKLYPLPPTPWRKTAAAPAPEPPVLSKHKVDPGPHPKNDRRPRGWQNTNSVWK